jgi:hypothetical protein
MWGPGRKNYGSSSSSGKVATIIEVWVIGVIYYEEPVVLTVREPVADIIYTCPTKARYLSNLAEASFGAPGATCIDPKDSPITEEALLVLNEQ